MALRTVGSRLSHCRRNYFKIVSIQTPGVVKFKRTCPVEVSHLDHLVLTVKSVPDTVNFYTSTLGMEVITFKVCGVTIEEGPVERSGAVGTITSLYFRDPDHNLIEVSNYNQSTSEGSS